ncbi:hypothetical protein RRG08_043708 [Elysia crispata]|uniref:Fibronectin type-III domain-containing protein n=1 Tax=Elysia crispata TaxID=231223 RepID=A0AAE0ZN30_9GAST|nr:hypothetical protein RRG08_043708 [Elysia crispata]
MGAPTSFLCVAPLTYPEFVQVTSFPGNSVFVFWRSVTTGLLEEPVAGYKLRWWPLADNILTANDTVIPGGLTYGVIRGLQRGVVYSLRVLGYSAAGDGKKSPTVYFTLEGQVRINPETSELMNRSPQLEPCFNKPLLNLVICRCRNCSSMKQPSAKYGSTSRRPAKEYHSSTAQISSALPTELSRDDECADVKSFIYDFSSGGLSGDST